MSAQRPSRNGKKKNKIIEVQLGGMAGAMATGRLHNSVEDVRVQGELLLHRPAAGRVVYSRSIAACLQSLISDRAGRGFESTSWN